MVNLLGCCVCWLDDCGCFGVLGFGCSLFAVCFRAWWLFNLDMVLSVDVSFTCDCEFRVGLLLFVGLLCICALIDC